MSNNKKIEVHKTLKMISNANTIICHRQIGMIFLEWLVNIGIGSSLGRKCVV
jgi:hypothetical protein